MDKLRYRHVHMCIPPVLLAELGGCHLKYLLRDGTHDGIGDLGHLLHSALGWARSLAPS